MGYMGRQGAKWASKHPKGSAISGIIFGSIFSYIFFRVYMEGEGIGLLLTIGAVAYTIWCITLLFKAD